jgi:uncharacterized membrane protein
MATNNHKPVTPIVEVRPGPAQNQTDTATARPPGKALALAGTVLLGLLVLALALPGDMLHKVILLNSGICPQRPAHSFFFQERQMPLEARMTGIFGSYFLTLLSLWLVGRGRALQLPRRTLTIVLLGMVAVMVGDGLNATFWDLGWPTLYQPQNWLRVIVGAISGVGMAGLILPMYSLTVWRRGYLTPAFRRGREIGYALIPAGLLVLGTFSGWSPLFWPLALIAVGGAITMLVMFNLIIFTILLKRENSIENGWGLITPVTVALLISLGQMGLFALLRVATLGSSYS